MVGERVFPIYPKRIEDGKQPGCCGLSQPEGEASADLKAEGKKGVVLDGTGEPLREPASLPVPLTPSSVQREKTRTRGRRWGATGAHCCRSRPNVRLAAAGISSCPHCQVRADSRGPPTPGRVFPCVLSYVVFSDGRRKRNGQYFLSPHHYQKQENAI